MDHPKGLIERFYGWSLAMREAFRAVSAEQDYRTMFDPYWVRVDPYRVTLSRGGGAEAMLCVRNFLARPQPYRVAMHCPAGITAEPAVIEGATAAEAIVRIPLKLKAAADAKVGTHIVGLDITLDGKRYGEWFDFIVGVQP
jgi:hypothetical protein